MSIRQITTNPPEIEVETIVVGVYTEGGFSHPAALVDRATGGLISGLMETGEITGRKNETTSLLRPAGVRADHVLVVGLGDREQVDRGVAHRAAGTAAKRLASRRRDSVAFCLSNEWSAELTEAAVAGAVVGFYGQDLYKSEKRVQPPDDMAWYGNADGVVTGQTLGESINFTRRLINSGPHELYPESFANHVTQVARMCGMECTVWNHARIKTENCGALLAVAQGSEHEPRLVEMRYRGADENAPTLALVGKGITFDSGGLSLKSSEGMKTMKSDMAGAATVAGAMRAIAQMRLPVNVLGVMALAENMTGPAAYKLGDVITARNETTIEVLNTDAEGRLVLADALDIARTSGVHSIIDVATLTGACVVALGTDVTGVMTNNQAWCDELLKAAHQCGEPIWQLPMFEAYGEAIKSEVADIRNVGKGRWGGAITAAKFLERFVGNLPWAHLDIAGPAFRDSAKPWCDAGASGEMVRTLVEVAARWADREEEVVFE